MTLHIVFLLTACGASSAGYAPHTHRSGGVHSGGERPRATPDWPASPDSVAVGRASGASTDDGVDRFPAPGSSTQLVAEGSDSGSGSQSEQIRRATSLARAELAAQLRVRVQSVTQVSSERDVTTVGGDRRQRQIRTHESLQQDISAASDLVLEGVRTAHRCEPARCTVRATLDLPEATRRTSARMSERAQVATAQLAAARAQRAAGDPLFALRTLAEAERVAADARALWDVALSFDARTPAPEPTAEDLTRERTEAVGALRLVATGRVGDGEMWDGFWGLVSAQLVSRGWPPVAGAGDAHGWLLGGRATAEASPRTSALVTAHAQLRFTLTHEGVSVITVDAAGRGGGRDESAALRGAVEDLAERTAESLIKGDAAR